MGPTSKFTILLLGLSTCCLALPRRGGDDLPKPVLPQSLEKAGAAEQEAGASRKIVKPAGVVQEFPAGAIVTPFFSSSVMSSMQNVANAIKVAQALKAPFGSGDNSIVKKIGDYLESFRIVKKIRDRCSDDKTKGDVSCTTTEVHGYPDIFGEAWHKLTEFYKKWADPISDRITEKKDVIDDAKNPGGSSVVTKPNTYFANFIKYLDMFGLDGKPEIVYEKSDEQEETKKEEEEEEEKKHEKTPQQIKDDALTGGDFHLIKKIERHNYFQKSVNALIKLGGLGIVGALCAQNCGFENLFGAGASVLPPLTDDQEAANQAAALADAAGDTDGDGDVDADDGRRRDTQVLTHQDHDTYQGYEHHGEYLPYGGLQQPQPQQESHVKGGRDPGYAYGTHPGWYQVVNNNNHLVEPQQHPDFSSRLLPLPVNQHQPAIQEGGQTEDHSPQPVFRGARMLQGDPK